MNALNQAILKAGSQKALAAQLGVVQSAIANWLKREKVPAEYCPSIEDATGVTCEELRPDVNWAVVRGQPLPPKLIGTEGAPAPALADKKGAQPDRRKHDLEVACTDGQSLVDRRVAAAAESGV